MRYLDFDVDENFRETTVHGDESFPMAVYLQRFQLNQRGYVILHWHEEVQISYVTKGVVQFFVSGKEILVQAGEGLFIRSKCLHSAKPQQDKSEYICIDIHPSLIYGIPNGRIRTQYVDPFLKSDCVEALHFTHALEWHSCILEKIQKIIRVEEASEYGYELELQITACDIWLDIVRNMHKSCSEEPWLPVADKQRMKTILQFIRENYTSKITLSDIAQSVNVSTAECCRLFKRNMNISPVEYLINYRVAQSVRLLTETEKSISEIAYLSGFGSSSYYTERFRKLIHCTPMEYRKSHANNQ